jgi:hypothetical protein
MFDEDDDNEDDDDGAREEQLQPGVGRSAAQRGLNPWTS